MLRYNNNWFQLHISEQGVVVIKDNVGADICSWSYAATYGDMTNGETPVIEANESEIYVRNASIFSIGDEIQIINKSVNEQVLHTATLTGVDIENNILHFTPATPANFSIPSWNSQSPVGTLVKKITYQCNSFNTCVITEQDTENDKNVILTGETDKATVEVLFKCYESSAKIDVIVTTTYKDAVKVFNESMILEFTDAVSRVFRKNRQTHKDNFHSRYWLGNQGVMFGHDYRTCLIYNTPKVTSLELETVTKKLTINLDDMRDHRFRRLDQYRVGYSEGMWIDRNAAEFTTGQTRVNNFTMWVGMSIKEVPRLMLNPDRYLSTFVLESHADSSPIAQQRAVAYGHEDILPGQEATGGLVGNNIKVTNSYFYGGVDYSLRGTNWETDSEVLTDAFDIAVDLYSKGFDICLHSIFWSTGYAPGQTRMADATVIQGKEEAIPFMQQYFDMKTWVDHSPQQNGLDMTTEGLIESSPCYLKNLWEQYGVKYFWNHSSEDLDPYLIDLLGGGRDDDSYRSPLYWKHPTVTGDFFIKATQYNNPGGQSGWDANYSEENLNHLVEHWGVHIQHNYLGMSNRQTIKQVDGKWVIDPIFESVLQRIALYRDRGKINVTTTRDIMDYWLLLENISFEYKENGDVVVSNNNDVMINGLSLAIESPYYGVAVDGVRPQRKIASENSVVSFDIDAGESKTIKIIKEKPYRFIKSYQFVTLV